MSSEILWKPEPSRFQSSNLAHFSIECGFDPHDYNALHSWSIADKGAFWSKLWDFTNVIGERGGTDFVYDAERPMTGSKFFPEARINLAENLLLRGEDADTALIEADEAGSYRTITRGELRAMVARVANGLRQSGVTKDDCVAGILPNRVEALVALLATAAIGATWSSCSPDFGAIAILDRLGQIKPKVLFASPTYLYGGKVHDIGSRIVEIASGMPGLQHVVLTGDAGLHLPDGISPHAYEAFGNDAPLEFERVPFSHPVYVLYTSGTTGAPKAIVHSVGGVILQHMKEHVLHGDVRPGDVLSWYTNTAWMMYHWVISGLGCGATVVLYDGAPILKTPLGLDVTPLWNVAEKARITHFGTSPKYLAVLADEGYKPGEWHDLSALKSVLSAGAPVSPHQFDWVYDAIKKDMIFASISGGTEIIGCFMLGSPLHPVRRGELTVKGLGLAVAVMDDRNAPIVGSQGDLVCTEPFPSMPITFWGDGGYERYMNTYFDARREIWTHGDVAELTPNGSAIIYGRSDTTLKPGGVRIGTAEIYAACEHFKEIEDCLVFGAPISGDEEIVLCVKLKDDIALSAELARNIRGRIREQASPRHVPHRIHAVHAVPYTLNGKRVEGAARTVLEGGVVKNLGSLANPECLTEYGTLDRSHAA